MELKALFFARFANSATFPLNHMIVFLCPALVRSCYIKTNTHHHHHPVSVKQTQDLTIPFNLVTCWRCRIVPVQLKRIQFIFALQNVLNGTSKRRVRYQRMYHARASVFIMGAAKFVSSLLYTHDCTFVFIVSIITSLTYHSNDNEAKVCIRQDRIMKTILTNTSFAGRFSWSLQADSMKLIILNDYDQVSEWAAKYIRNSIRKFNPGPNRFFTLGLPTGMIFKQMHCIFSVQSIYDPSVFGLYFLQEALPLDATRNLLSITRGEKYLSSMWKRLIWMSM